MYACLRCRTTVVVLYFAKTVPVHWLCRLIIMETFHKSRDARLFVGTIPPCARRALFALTSRSWGTVHLFSSVSSHLGAHHTNMALSSINNNTRSSSPRLSAAAAVHTVEGWWIFFVTIFHAFCCCSSAGVFAGLTCDTLATLAGTGIARAPSALSPLSVHQRPAQCGTLLLLSCCILCVDRPVSRNLDHRDPATVVASTAAWSCASRDFVRVHDASKCPVQQRSCGCACVGSSSSPRSQPAASGNIQPRRTVLVGFLFRKQPYRGHTFCCARHRTPCVWLAACTLHLHD